MNHPLDIIGGTIGVIHSFCFRSVPITSGRALLPFCRYINQIDYSGIIGADALAVQWTAKEKRRSLFWEASPLFSSHNFHHEARVERPHHIRCTRRMR